MEIDLQQYDADSGLFYKNIEGVRGPSTTISMSQEQLEEYLKCSEDPKYFIENYCYLIDANGKKILFKLRPYQDRFIDLMHNNRFVVGKLPRQVGKSAIVSVYLLWNALFTENFNILIAANRSKSAKEIMGKVKVALQNLPLWLQPGCTRWGVESLGWENGSRISAEATTENSGRSGTNQIIMLDEFAFVRPNIADAFLAGVYPTIAGGDVTKVFVISTPNGLNHFYEMWEKAIKGKSNFKPIEIAWNDVPGRDEEYKRLTIENTSIETWLQEYECQFIGSADTLISPAVLGQLAVLTEDAKDVIDNHLKIFEDPRPDHNYFITVDTSRGKGIDYSAFVVFDITRYPYKVVATYKNNEIPVMLYPNKIYEVGLLYNTALILCELNDLGQQVAETLYYELEYENMLFTSNQGRSGKQLSEGGDDVGVFTTQAVRRIGCSQMKSLVESRQVTIPDFGVVHELSNFVLHKAKFQAIPPNNDDLVMCLVIFAWAVNTQYFKELTDLNVRHQIYADQMKAIEEDLVPFGFRSDGSEFDEEKPAPGWINVRHNK